MDSTLPNSSTESFHNFETITDPSDKVDLFQDDVFQVEKLFSMKTTEKSIEQILADFQENFQNDLTDTLTIDGTESSGFLSVDDVLFQVEDDIVEAKNDFQEALTETSDPDQIRTVLDMLVDMELQNQMENSNGEIKVTTSKPITTTSTTDKSTKTHEFEFSKIFSTTQKPFKTTTRKRYNFMILKKSQVFLNGHF